MRKNMVIDLILQGVHLICQLFRKPLQSLPKPNQDTAALLVRNHAKQVTKWV